MNSNIIVIVIDSLRQDKCFGKSKKSDIPNLDQFIKHGTFFTQAISSAPITIPSLSSIFTGLYPFESTVQDNDLFNLNPNLDTFVDDLVKSGYHTYAVIPESMNHTNIPKLFMNVEFFNSFATLYDENLGNKIINMIKNNTMKSPWFLFIHLQDLHGNAVFHLGNSPKEFEDDNSGINQYEKMLSVIDPWLGKILECLDSTRTISVITSDHGSVSADFTNEMFNFVVENSKLKTIDPGLAFKSTNKIVRKFPKHLNPFRKKLSKIYTENKNNKIKKRMKPQIEQIKNFDLTLYQKRLLKTTTLFPRDCFDEHFRPALIFSGPCIPSGKIITTQSSLLDIFPTLLELAKISTQINHRGKSLVSKFNDVSSTESVVMIDGTSSKSESNHSDTIGIRTEKLKYFRDRFDEGKNVHLYDLENDPMEEYNIYDKNPEIIKTMEYELKKINSNRDFSFQQTNEINDLNAKKAKDLLRDLGYV